MLSLALLHIINYLFHSPSYSRFICQHDIQRSNVSFCQVRSNSQMCLNSILSIVPSYWVIFTVVSSSYVRTFLFQLSSTDSVFYSSTPMDTIGFVAERYGRASVNQFFADALENEQFSRRFSIRALKPKKFFEWLRDADIPLTRKMFCLITDKRAIENKEKAVLPSRKAKYVQRARWCCVIRIEYLKNLSDSAGVCCCANVWVIRRKSSLWSYNCFKTKSPLPESSVVVSTGSPLRRLPMES